MAPENTINRLQRSKKIHELLLFCRAQRVEAVDYGVRFRMDFSAITGVVLDRHEQVCRSAIVQEEHALTNAPKRGGPE